MNTIPADVHMRVQALQLATTGPRGVDTPAAIVKRAKAYYNFMRLGMPTGEVKPLVQVGAASEPEKEASPEDSR